MKPTLGDVCTNQNCEKGINDFDEEYTSQN